MLRENNQRKADRKDRVDMGRKGEGVSGQTRVSLGRRARPRRVAFCWRGIVAKGRDARVSERHSLRKNGAKVGGYPARPRVVVASPAVRDRQCQDSTRVDMSRRTCATSMMSASVRAPFGALCTLSATCLTTASIKRSLM